jgi:Flp pilus assembly protein TadG
VNERALSPRSRTEKPSRLRLGVRHLAKGEHGTAVVEFALIAPLLFLLVFGIIEFGRILNAYTQVTQLAGQGARAAAVNRNPDGTAIAASAGTIDNVDCGGQSYSIQCQLSKYYATNDALSNVHACIVSTAANPFPTNPGQPVTVKVSYQYNFITGLFGFGNITLSSTQTERAEGTPSYTAGNENGAACS